MESILQSSLISEMVAEEQRRAQARNRRRSTVGQADPVRPKTPADPEHGTAGAGGAAGMGTASELRLKEQVLREREAAIKQREERLESECASPGLFRTSAAELGLHSS